MATRTTISPDGPPRWRSGKGALVLLLSLAVVALAGCNLDEVTSPNDPAELTGQNPTQTVTFNGNIDIFFGGTSVGPDGVPDVLITARAFDARGDLVQNGTPIDFNTTFGLLRPEGAPPSEGSGSVSVITFNGTATVALRATSGGQAIVTASIVDVSASLVIDFEDLPLAGTLDLQVRVDGVLGDTGTTEAPATVDLVATALDEEGIPLAGVRVRFRIVIDRSIGSGVGPARIVGQGTSRTDTSGQAVERARINGAGDVVFEAQLLDPDSGEVVATSNQAIVTTLEPGEETFSVDLSFTDGSASFSDAAPYSAGMTAEVTDGDGNSVPGRTVRFTIVSDTTDTGATLAGGGTTSTTTTNSSGEAFETVNVPDDGTPDGSGQVTVEAELLDDTGAVIATSNQIVATGE